MPAETKRIYGKKLIKLPSGNSVPINVIKQITFVDDTERGQEYVHTIDNSAQAFRDVHVDRVSSSGSGGRLDVERIDVWRVLDATDRAQETFVTFDNTTGGDSTPPHFSTHIKTHVVRFLSGSDYVDTELIDEFSILDPIAQYQETHYFLDNPPGEDDGQGHLIVQVDPDAVDVSDTGAIDPPWRTDPFQNIVDYSEAETAVVTWQYWRQNDHNPANTPTNVTGDMSFFDVSLAVVPGYPHLPTGFAVSGAPSVTGIAAQSRQIAWLSQFNGHHTTDPTVPDFAGTADIVFTGTATVTGTADVVFFLFDGTPSEATAGTITASVSGLTGTMNSIPWVLHGMEVIFVAERGSAGAPPAILNGLGYPVFVLVSATFKPHT